MIFQGAPGAGKSALMFECIEAVRRHSTPEYPWITVSLNPSTLKSAAHTIALIVNAANAESERLAKAASGAVSTELREFLKLGRRIIDEFSLRGIGIGGFSIGGKPQSDDTQASELPAEWVFSETAPFLKNFHFVIFVDEAQNIPIGEMTAGVLDSLHRKSEGIPLVAAFFGLSDTEKVLNSCGLSRFPRNRVVNLEPLSIMEAAASFRRMINTYYRGSNDEKSHWAGALAELSQGWPQHISGIGSTAGQIIRANGGYLKHPLLEQALAEGANQKNEYYFHRLNTGKYPPRVYRQLALAAGKKQGDLAGIVTYEEVDSLTESVRRKRNQTVDEFVTTALHAGILAPAKSLPYHYCFPIPSLGDYLRALPPTTPDTL